MARPSFSEIVSTVLRNRSGQLQANIQKNNAALAAMRGSGVYVDQSPPEPPKPKGPSLATIWETLTDIEKGYLLAYAQAFPSAVDVGMQGVTAATLPFVEAAKLCSNIPLRTDFAKTLIKKLEAAK